MQDFQKVRRVSKGGGGGGGGRGHKVPKTRVQQVLKI